MQNIFKITFVILGSIIGAGFISGQEINLFFNKHGSSGIIGIIFSGIIMGLIIRKTCLMIKEKNINNYQEFINETIPIKNKYIKLIINNLITIFLLISFFIMCSAFNSYFNQEFNIPIFLIGIINFILCYFIFKNNTKLIIKINEILIPIILILILFLIFKQNIIFNFEIINYNKIINPIYSGLIYASYNTILLIPFLITLNKLIINKKQINLFSLIFTIIIILIELIIFLLMNLLGNIKGIQIPLIYIANSMGNIYHYIYGAVIIGAIITSAISAGYGFLKNVAQTKKGYNILALTICFTSIFVSYFGFSNLVNLLYPIFGVLGLVQILFIFIE